MNKEQIDFLNNKLNDCLKIIDCQELKGVDFKIKEKDGNAIIFITINDNNNYIWKSINLKTRIKSLDHLDRLILAVKNLVKELE